MLEQPVSSASVTGPDGVVAQWISPVAVCGPSTKSTASRTVATSSRRSSDRRSPIRDATRRWRYRRRNCCRCWHLRRRRAGTASARIRRVVVEHETNRMRARLVDQPGGAQGHRAFDMIPRVGVPTFGPGISPDEYCSAAMESAVWRHCAGVSAPVTAGMFSRSGVGGIGVRLLEIERDALTHQGIEQRFRGAGEDGPRHHVPKPAACGMRSLPDGRDYQRPQRTSATRRASAARGRNAWV